MSRSVHRLALAVVLAGCVAASDTSGNPWVVPKDNSIADDVTQAISDYCSGATMLDDAQVESAKQDLLNALGGENFILDTLKSAETQDDLSSEALETVTAPGWIIPRAAPLIGAILILIVFCGCCWSTCPCCKCCRCCSRERQSTLKAKVVVSMFLGVCFISIAAGLAQTTAGFGKARDGFMTMSCTSAQMLNATLFGEDDPFFVGMVPALDTMWTLSTQLDDGSPLMTDATGVLDNTGPIQDAVTLAVDTINLMSSVLELPANLHPKSASGEDLLHKCQLCEDVAVPLATISSELQSGVGAALAAAREEVQQQLNGGSRSGVQDLLRDAAKPLVEFKNMIRSTFASFIDPDVFGQIEQHVNTTVFAAVNVFCLGASLLLISGFIATGCWALRERKGGSYARCPHRCSCCTMCCAVLCFVMPVLVVGGLLGVVAIPLAGMCLTMDELDGPTFREIVPALGMDLPEDQKNMMASFVDQCIAGTGGGNPNLLDMVTSTDSATGAQTNMRAQLMSTVSGPLDTVFDGLASAMDGSASVAGSQDIQDFVAMLRRTPIDARIIADSAKVQAHAAVSPMLSYAPLMVGEYTSAKCANFTGDPGISHFVDRLAELGPKLPGSSCAQNVDCSGSSDPSACNAGNAYVDLKRTLIQPTPRLYRCDVFESSLGTACDPKDMTSDGSGGWVNDCLLRSNGSGVTTSVKEVSCNLQEFTAYVQGYEDRILKVLYRLDNATADTQTLIATELRNIVDRYILNPFLTIVNGITCGFMPVAFNGFLNGFCYQGVIGFRMMASSYVLFAAAVLLMCLAMYIQWRLAVDNVNAECAAKVMVAPEDACPPPL